MQLQIVELQVGQKTRYAAKLMQKPGKNPFLAKDGRTRLKAPGMKNSFVSAREAKGHFIGLGGFQVAGCVSARTQHRKHLRRRSYVR